MDYENIKVDVADGILRLTIDRPKVLNALNAQTVAEIDRAFREARNDDNVRAVIVTGAGEKAFVAGADINELAAQTPISHVNRVVPLDRLLPTGEELAKKIASRAPIAVKAAIEAVVVGSEMPSEEGQLLEATLFGLLCATKDTKEGMQAFLEKRPADF